MLFVVALRYLWAIMMTLQNWKFVNAYCADPKHHGTNAALSAGYSEISAHVIASELLKKPEIIAAIDDQMDAIYQASCVSVEKILREWQAIAFADCNEIVELRRECCRHCYGVGHAYQWTEAEFTAALNRAIDSGKNPPDGMGGFGFDQNNPPVEGCPECGGHGWERAHIHDTRQLKGRARRLYAGIQKTKDGFKVNFRDQEKALDNLAKYFGMLIEKKELSGPGGGAIPIASISAEDLSDDQLAAYLGNHGANAS